MCRCGNSSAARSKRSPKLRSLAARPNASTAPRAQVQAQSLQDADRRKDIEKLRRAAILRKMGKIS
jgi:hypothetical protein